MAFLYLSAIVSFLACFSLVNVQRVGNPGLPDSPVAHAVFAAAERNRTQDGYLTHAELDDIFQTFDSNSDGLVDEQEFIYVWKDRHLGELTHAVTLFHHADTDRDDFISKVPDLERVFYYFDRDQDGRVSEQEFVLIWVSLSM